MNLREFQLKVVNDFGDYPDIICDICSDVSGLEKKYDKIICIAILEHVYDPTAAVANLKKILKDNGVIYGYVPYLYYYHAPKDLKFETFDGTPQDEATCKRIWPQEACVSRSPSGHFPVQKLNNF